MKPDNNEMSEQERAARSTYRSVMLRAFHDPELQNDVEGLMSSMALQMGIQMLIDPNDATFLTEVSDERFIASIVDLSSTLAFAMQTQQVNPIIVAMAMAQMQWRILYLSGAAQMDEEFATDNAEVMSAERFRTTLHKNVQESLQRIMDNGGLEIDHVSDKDLEDLIKRASELTDDEGTPGQYL